MPAARKPPSSRCTVISGIFQIEYRSENEANGDSDDDDDEENDPWLDFEEMEESSVPVQSCIPKMNKVRIKDDSGNVHTCTGKFPLTHVFWRVTVKVSNGWLRSAPSYAIRTDENVQKQKLVMIFLTECLTREKLSEDTVNGVTACFDAFCRLTGRKDSLKFCQLGEFLQTYTEQEGSEGCCLGKVPGTLGQHQQMDHSAFIRKNVLKSDLGAMVLRAASHPALVKTLSELLPYSFMQFLHKLELKEKENKEKGEDSVLQKAVEMANHRPWEFVFRDIIYAKLKLQGTEATLSAYESAGYLSRTPQREKDAIFIYEALKLDASKDGNVYMRCKWLKIYIKKLDYQIDGEKRWQEAFEYLESSNTIKRELFDGDVIVFLRYNWQAEMDTVEGFEQILQSSESDPLDWAIDCRSPDFESLCSDPDQLNALHLIASSPITVISGKGGCGKTTVITKLLQYLCDQMERKIQADRQEELEMLNATEDTQSMTNLDSNFTDSCEDLSQCQSSSDASYRQSSSGSHSERSSCQHPTNITVTASVPGDTSEQPKPEDSKELKLRKEVIMDLIRFFNQKKDVDDPLLQEYKKTILLTAPTGKAARLLGHKAKLHSATLHSVIMSWRMHAKMIYESEKKEIKPWTYSTVEILVVDECSLVSVRLFACVMNILLRHANLRKIVLLGDVRQLPSIEAGNFLTDVFKAFKTAGSEEFGLSLELTKNHRSESELIVENAGNIANKIMPTFSEEKRFHLKEISEFADSNECDEAVRDLLKHVGDVQSHEDSQFISFRNSHCKAVNEVCCLHYNKHPTAAASTRGKKGRTDFRIGDKICFGKNNLVPNFRNLMLNRYIEDSTALQEAVNVHRHQKQHPQQDTTHTVCSYSHGSQSRAKLDTTQALKLLEIDDATFDCTVSKMRKKECKTEEAVMERAKQERLRRAGEQQAAWKASQVTGAPSIGKESEKLCNGEVFFIMDEIEQPVRYLILSDRDPDCPRVVCAPFKLLRKQGRMRHSWARTIHTFQGSESDTVVYVLGKAVPQNWQHVYTAITRGKKSVYIIGSRAELYKAINRSDPPRRSRLGNRLQAMIKRNLPLVEACKVKFLESFHMDDRKVTTASSADEILDSSDSWMFDSSLEQTLEDAARDEKDNTDSQFNLSNDPNASEFTSDFSDICSDSSKNDLNRDTLQHKIVQDNFNVFDSDSFDDNEAMDIIKEVSVTENDEDFLPRPEVVIGYGSPSAVNQNTEDQSLKSCFREKLNRISSVKSSSADKFSGQSNLEVQVLNSPPQHPVEMLSCQQQLTPSKPACSTSRGSPADSSLHSPRKRHTGSPLNTPFRNNFTHLTLSEKVNGTNEEEPSSSHKRKNARRSLNIVS